MLGPGCHGLGQNGFMTLDLNGYFDRINYRGAAEPNLDVLQNLVTAHTRTIPFENLDPLMGVPVDDLSPEALTDKLVNRRRGGLLKLARALPYVSLWTLGTRSLKTLNRPKWEIHLHRECHSVPGFLPAQVEFT